MIFIFVLFVKFVVKIISTPAIPLIFLPEIFLSEFPATAPWSKIAHGISGLGQKPPKYGFSPEK
jgi:hypothetical protein